MTVIPATLQLETVRFEPDCREAVQLVRGRLIELYASMDLDPSQPQEVARRMGLNKNLTWKISKIINATEALSAIPHMPGASGMEILLTSLETAGAPRQLIDGVREATDRFDQVVERHAGDRANLDLMLDSMGLGASALPLLTSRELAFQGNSGLWGVQARTRVTAAFVVPNKEDSSLVDTALVGGFVGFRRLRPTMGWPLFRFQFYDDTGSFSLDKGEEIDPTIGPNDPVHLLKKYCSATMPNIITKSSSSVTEYLLPEGPVGNQGAFDCYFGNIVRGSPRYRSPTDDHADFSSSITVPIETLVFDLIFHRSLEIQAPDVRVYGRPTGSPDVPSARADSTLLPLAERCVELAGSPPAVATPLIPRYAELVADVQNRFGFPGSQFRGYRLVLKFPPMASTVVLRWPLSERPRA